MYCVGTQIPLLGQGTPDCGFQRPRVRWKVSEVWLIQHMQYMQRVASEIVTGGGGGVWGIYWMEAYNTNLIVVGIY